MNNKVELTAKNLAIIQSEGMNAKTSFDFLMSNSIVMDICVTGNISEFNNMETWQQYGRGVNVNKELMNRVARLLFGRLHAMWEQRTPDERASWHPVNYVLMDNA